MLPWLRVPHLYPVLGFALAAVSLFSLAQRASLARSGE